MRVLVLCSGTGSVDRAFERRGWCVVSVDWLAKFQPTICVDIMQWDYKAAFPNDHFQFVWCSPDCSPFFESPNDRRAKRHQRCDGTGCKMP